MVAAGGLVGRENGSRRMPHGRASHGTYRAMIKSVKLGGSMRRSWRQAPRDVAQSRSFLGQLPAEMMGIGMARRSADKVGNEAGRRYDESFFLVGVMLEGRTLGGHVVWYRPLERTRASRQVRSGRALDWVNSQVPIRGPELGFVASSPPRGSRRGETTPTRLPWRFP